MQDDHNALINGKFLHNLNGWTPSAGVTYSAGDGDDNYGVAVLPLAESIWQEFSVDEEALQSLHISVKAVGASLSGSQATLVIKDNYDNTVITQNLAGRRIPGRKTCTAWVSLRAQPPNYDHKQFGSRRHQNRRCLDLVYPDHSRSDCSGSTCQTWATCHGAQSSHNPKRRIDGRLLHLRH